jgi:hypothetical protein
METRMTRLLKTTAGEQTEHVPLEVVTTVCTASLRVPVSPANRQILRAMRAAELEFWEHPPHRKERVAQTDGARPGSS